MRRQAAVAVPLLLLTNARAPKMHGTRRVTQQGVREMEQFTAAFARQLEDVAARNAAGVERPRRVFLLDVGANDGRWSDAMMRHLNSVLLRAPAGRIANATRVELVLIEPQLRFRALNLRRAAEWNGTFLPVAAWTEDAADLPFQSNRNSEMAGIASTQPTPVVGRRPSRERRIRAIDFASFVLRALPSDALTWLKMDIEGAEYAVLPRLLLSGALCSPVRFLQVEWHLNNLPPSRRAEGLALRRALGSLIDAGCPSRSAAHGLPARQLLHEEYRGTNFDIHVPGLLEEAVRHVQPCASTQRCSWQPVNLSGRIPLQGVQYDARVGYYFAAKFLTYVNGVR